MIQCYVVRGSVHKTVWIPKKFAITNKHLKINGENGWLVKKVYRIELASKHLGMISDSYKNTRKTSDI